MSVPHSGVQSVRSSRTFSGQSRHSGGAGVERKLAVIDDVTNGHLESIRERVATGTALRAIKSSQTIDGVKVGVALTLSKDDEQFMRHVVSKIKHSLALQEYLFVVAPAGPHHAGVWPIVAFGSSASLVEKAATLACAKFLGRLKQTYSEGGERWVGYVEDGGSSELDEAMLWDIVRKTPHVINPKSPPRGARGVDQLVAAARTRLERVTPKQALSEIQSLTFALPVVLVDIRSTQQREQHGEIPDSIVTERNVLEWRFDPRSETRLSIADRYDLRVIVFDQDGTASSLAAASLHDLGLLNATDIIGGFKAWKEAGLPFFTQPTPSLYS